ncbi:MAG: aldehyde dehydrogenase [Bdellovibrionales bacterium]|nr:aldehyde dehydrogenase [Bdellovibrionales bacterium]
MENLRKDIQSGLDVVIPPFVRDWLAAPKHHVIDGKFVASATSFETIYPGDGSVLATVSRGGKEEIDAAVAAAKQSFERGDWRCRSLDERCTALERLGALILEHLPVLALLESLDTGKPLRESFEGDIPRVARNFKFFAEFARQEGSACYPQGNTLHYSQREPLGVVALVTPWNLPLYLESWKLAPALAMGNSIVLKPSEWTPLTAAYFAEFLLPKVGIPSGVVNVVHGFGDGEAGEFLVSHPHVSAISFTGETQTGRAIMRSAAVGPTRLSFELGGKGASVVFADADLDKAAEVCTRAAFRNQGQICLASPRVFVEATCFEAFTEKLAARARNIKLGNPLNYQTEMGPLIGSTHFEKVKSYLSLLKAPARVWAGGETRSPGFYVEPTVVSGLPLDHAISCEEIFGPVVSVYPFKTENEVIEAVNATPYGLSASVWTRNGDRAHRVSNALRCGLVWVNAWFLRDLRVPFGGQKRSGLGREGGAFSLDFYSEWKSVSIQFSGEEAK